ncbi:MAG: integrase [Candidatus Thiodiazotropha sp.]
MKSITTNYGGMDLTGWQGPGKLWPVWKCEDIDKQSEEVKSDTESEFRRTEVLFETRLVAEEGPSQIRKGILQETPFNLNINSYSSVIKLWRVTALALRFVDRLRKKTSPMDPLHPDEIAKAEELWTRYVQKQQYNDVLESINESKFNILKCQLGIYIDSHGLLRCAGRLQNAELCENTRHPIILSRSHRYTDLIIERFHKTALHTGVSQTLSLIRQKYWIPQGRSAVRKVLQRCTTCRRHEGGSYRMPLMPPLPAECLTESPPFTYTGVDYFGPLYVKSKKDRQKAWVCLYTCLVTRAVHLELMHDMTTHEFLLGFRRFIARHGKPRKMISDNATQFKPASDCIDKLLGQILTQNDVVSYASSHDIRWDFIVESAPWMGSFYERLVALVKRSLRKAIGKVLSDE